MKFAKKRNIWLRYKQTAIALKRMQEYNAKTTSKFTQEIISLIKSTLNKIEKNKGEIMQKSDKELLELAAKAAEYDLYLYKNDVFHYEQLKLKTNEHWSQWKVWNPLQNDGDALRLAVKLEIDLQHNWSSVIAIYTRNDSVKIGIPSHTEVGGDEYEERLVATRRAIVNAAAEIGRNMK